MVNLGDLESVQCRFQEWSGISMSCLGSRNWLWGNVTGSKSTRRSSHILSQISAAKVKNFVGIAVSLTVRARMTPKIHRNIHKGIGMCSNNTLTSISRLINYRIDPHVHAR